MKKFYVTSVLLAGLLITANAMAVPYSTFDPRSFGMGGTGVASATSANASFYNPAMLAAAKDDEDFSLELPVFGARVSDPDDLVDAVDAFDSGNYINDFDAAVDAFNAPGGQTPANQSQVVSTANSLVSGLTTLSNKAIQAEAGVGIVIGIPSKKFGAALYTNGWVSGGGKAVISDADVAAVNAVIAAVGGLPASVPDLTGTYTSSMQARFAAVTEVGVSLARVFNIKGHDIAIGITPKAVKVKTYDYEFIGDALDTAEVDLDTGEKEESSVNLDVGIAKVYDNGWKTGLAIKNLIGKEYKTVLGNSLKIDPQVRIGVARQTEKMTLAVDLDVTENDPAGFESKTQYLGAGVELDAWGWAQLRLGYRHNLSDSDNSSASAGIGLSPFGVHIDLSVAGSSDEIGAAFQLGFRF